MYSKLFRNFSIGLMLSALVIYLLRGFEILTFVPGGWIYLCFFGAIAIGFLAQVAHRQRW